jgi:hypothetical protein
MRRSIAVAACGTLIAGAAAFHASGRAVAEDAEKAPSFTVEVVGVRTCGPAFKELQPFNTWEGTSVALLVKAEGVQVTGMDEGSRVKEFGDDTGADLFLGSGEMGRQTGFNSSRQVAKDASAILLEVETPKCATKGAKTAHVEGKIVLHAWNGTEAKKVDAEFKEGAKVDAGAFAFVIEKVSDSGWEEMPMQLTLKSPKSFEAVAGWKFLDEAGAEVKSAMSGTWSTGSASDTTYEYVINVGKKLQKGAIVVECRKEPKNLAVPFKLDASLGF